MNCEAARAAMEEEFAGELVSDRAEQLRAHVKSCDSCREFYERLARVDAVLERGGLSEQRLDALQARIPGLASQKQAPFIPSAPARRAWGPLLAAAAILVLVAGFAIQAWRASQVDPFTPRGGGTSWGVRAFCVTEGKVTGEALAGGTLVCAPGSLVQFTYTAPEAAQLSIAIDGSDLRFLDPSAVKPGTDVALSTSTPVGEWLAGPQRVTARFTDAKGATISESSLTITPR